LATSSLKTKSGTWSRGWAKSRSGCCFTAVGLLRKRPAF
jgi:hypothetical protein